MESVIDNKTTMIAFYQSSVKEGAIGSGGEHG